MARTTANNYGIDPDIFVGLIDQESGFTVDQTNRTTSAFGLGQNTTAALSDVGTTRAAIAGDAQAQLNASAAYLSKQLSAFGGNYTEALGAYNQGAAGFANNATKNAAGLSYASSVMNKAKSLMSSAGDAMSKVLNFDLGKAAENAVDTGVQKATGFDPSTWFDRIAIGLFALILIAAALIMLAPKGSIEKAAAVAA